MTFNELTMDLFDVAEDESWHLAHCVASDLALGAGIAVPMNAKFGLRRALLDSGESLKHPTCVLTGRVFNLVTKARSCDKPLIGDFLKALWMMKRIAVDAGVSYIAMPRIGCGLDGLPWLAVRESIKRTFSDTDVEILVCVWK